MFKDIDSVLKRSALFQGMNAKQLRDVITQLKPQRIALKEGEYLYRRGEAAECCWEVLSGHFLVQRSSLRHPFQVVDYQTGAVTGLLGLVEPGARRPVSLIADGAAELLEFRAEGIARLECSTRVLIWSNISHILIRKLFQCRSRLASLGA